MSGNGQQGGYGQGARAPATQDNPQIVSGWQHTPYAHNSERYAYIGKSGITGEPQWIDYGGKRANAEAAAQKGGKK